MYLLIVFLPLLSAFISGFFGFWLAKKGSVIITVCLMCFTALLSLLVFYEVVLCHNVCTFTLFSWVGSNSLLIHWGFLFDGLTATMLVVVNFVSFLVHLYSSSYMGEDPHVSRFMSYLSLFTFFMLMLVTADNYVQMFLGWEGVGLASYLLINFWHTRIFANQAAMKAMIINRIGDFGLVLGLAFIFIVFKTFDFSIIFALSPLFFQDTFIFFSFEINKLTLISLLLFVGAVGKSAQIGLHTWLPDAMEGPTPVSALIHAATMVTAGVFVLLRSSPILEYSNTGLMIITIIGALTAFMAATIGVVQNDLKKVIAYSTCSQLGYMIFSCGLSNYSVSLFHLMNHAFFKALLFLSAGSVIHALADEQDMRKMGGLVKSIPVTYVMILIGSLSLMGFPFLTGFYSKDVILELSFSSYHFSGLFAYWLGTLSAFFTSFYSIRLVYLTFLDVNNNSSEIVSHVHESDWIMLIPLLILSIGSIFVGYIFKDLFLGLGVNTWNGIFYQLPSHTVFFEAEFLPFHIKLIPVFFSFCGALVAFLFYSLWISSVISLNFYKSIYYIYNFFVKKWYFDIIYNYYVAYGFLSFGYFVSFKLIDRGLIEVVGPLGIVRLFNYLSQQIAFLQSGQIFHYAFVMLLGITIYLLTFQMFYPIILLIGVSFVLFYSLVIRYND